MQLQRQDGHNQDVYDSGQWHFYVMFLELVLFVIVLVLAQVHMRGQLAHKLVF